MDTKYKEPWLTHLDKEYLSCEEGAVEHDIVLIMKDMLLPDDSENAALTAAQRINTYYWDRNLDSGPLFRFQREEEGTFDFLTFIYDIIIAGIAPFVPYSDSRHDALVQLVIELYRLPPKPVKAWNGDRLVPPGGVMFPGMLDEAWSGTYAGDSREKTASSSEWKQECSEWLNLSSFIARCTGARVDDHLPDITKYSSIDIKQGLENEIPPGLTRDTRVMIAAQHILLAGRVVDEELVRKPKSSWGLDKWQVWAKKLKELTEKELAPEVKIAVVEARKKLVELHPELFPTSEGGNKPDL